jgi:integrase/recombinase XerC
MEEANRDTANEPETANRAGIAWEDALRRFKAHLLTKRQSPHTVHRLLQELADFARWWPGHTADPLSPGAVRECDLTAWWAWLRVAAVSKGTRGWAVTVTAKVMVLKSFLRYCARVGRPRKRPLASPREKPGHREVRWLDRQQQDALLRRASGDKRDYAVVRLLLDTGLHVSELADLRWRQVRLSSGVVKVPSGHGRTRRRIPLGRETRAALRAIRAGSPHPPGVDSQGGSATADAPVFPGSRGPLSVRSIQLLLSRLGDERAGLANLSPRVLRDTFAINLRDQKVPWPTISALLGHRSVQETMDLYAPAPEPDLVEAAAPHLSEEGTNGPGGAGA